MNNLLETIEVDRLTGVLGGAMTGQQFSDYHTGRIIPNSTGNLTGIPVFTPQGIIIGTKPPGN